MSLSVKTLPGCTFIVYHSARPGHWSFDPSSSLLAATSREVADDGSSAWAPAINMEDLGRIQGSQLQADSSLALVLI